MYYLFCVWLNKRIKKKNKTYNQGCQFSDFSLISDFLRIKENGIKLIKYCLNMDKISVVSKDKLGSGKGLDNPSLNTVSTY